MDAKEINKICRDFRMAGSRLLSTKFGTEQSDLARFLLFIEKSDIIFNFIEGCSNKDYDIKAILSEKEWNHKLQLPLEPSEEIAYIYQLLKYINVNQNYTNVSFGYGSGKKFQDHLDAFNNQVTLHLINHIREFLEDQVINLEPIDSSEIGEINPLIFISYCWADEPFTNLIDSDFQDLNYKLTRDQRDLKFKESIKQFMQTIGKHDYVISLISDSYLKSVNCMYEIFEVMRSHEYKEKMLLVILKDSDINHLQDSERIENKSIGANIYSFEQQIHYIKYWESKELEYSSLVAGITNETNKIQPLQELKRIQSIASNIGEFLSDISDWNNTDLSKLKATNYEPFIKEINKKI